MNPSVSKNRDVMKGKAQTASPGGSVDDYVTKWVLFFVSLVDVSSLCSSVAGLVPRSETTTRPDPKETGTSQLFAHVGVSFLPSTCATAQRTTMRVLLSSFIVRI